jgi:GxxExxY protein
MNANSRGLKHEELTGRVLKVFYEVYNELGHGFLESIYQRAMAVALSSVGLRIGEQLPIAVFFRGQQIGAFAADLIVDGVVIVELKAARSLEPAHEAQLLNYLRATEMEVGMLLNFGPEPQFKRLVFENSRKTRRGDPKVSRLPASPIRENPR